jgi:signal transduction histidine kinase
MNLVVNARDAIGEHGMIGIEVEHRAIAQADLASMPGARVGDWVVVSVSDDGVGMSAETQARIFEPFFTTKAIGKGTGLGLSQIHGFVAQSGGFVAVRSALKAGTRVSLHFPVLA